MLKATSTLLPLIAAGGLALTAPAALASSPSPPAPQPITEFDWRGFYAGGSFGGMHIDAGAAQISPTKPIHKSVKAIYRGQLTDRLSADGNHVVAGLQIGYNWRADIFLFGLEADFQGSTAAAKKSKTQSYRVQKNSVRTEQHYRARMNWFATIRARLGVLITPSIMAYLTGGYAYADVDRSYGVVTHQSRRRTSNMWQGTGKTSHGEHGWVAGAGLEWAMGPRLSVGVEYLYMQLDNEKSFQTTEHSPLCKTGRRNRCARSIRSEDLESHIGRVKVNYKF